MAREAKTTENGSNRGTVLRYSLFCAAAVVCVVLFIVFGNKKQIEPSDEQSSDAVYSAAPLPSGIPYERFIEALSGAGLNCTVGEMEVVSDNVLRYSLIMEDPKDSGAVEITTDAYGRAAEIRLTVGYIRPESPDYDVAPGVRAAIEAENSRRTEFDETLIGKWLETVYGVFGNEYGIGSIDRSKLSSGVIGAYESGQTYETKAGKTRFFCTTGGESIHFEFDLTVSFTLSK